LILIVYLLEKKKKKIKDANHWTIGYGRRLGLRLGDTNASGLGLSFEQLNHYSFPGEQWGIAIVLRGTEQWEWVFTTSQINLMFPYDNASPPSEFEPTQTHCSLTRDSATRSTESVSSPQPQRLCSPDFI
jgi:hypothetical protein